MQEHASGATPAEPDSHSDDDAVQPPPGADPRAVRTNIGATDGAIPSSYGAGGELATDDFEQPA